MIAREGIKPLLVILALALAAFFYVMSITPVLLGVLIMGVFLFRDPRRQTPSSPLAVVSPAQGTVIATDTVDDHWISLQGITRQAQRIRIKISAVDVYSVCSPIEGKVMEQWSKKSVEGKCEFAFLIRTDEGDDVVTVLSMGTFAARFFQSYVQSGERLGQGQRCGYLYFGGTADVFVPLNAKLNVAVGQATTGSEDILAYLVHEELTSMINDNNPHGRKAVSGSAA